MGKERAMVAVATLQRRRYYVVKPANIVPVRNGFEYDVVLNYGIGPRPIVVSGSGSGRPSTGTTCAMGDTIYVSHGVVAPSGESNCAETCPDPVM